MSLLFKLLHHFIAHPLLILPWKWTTHFHDWTALWAFTPEIVCILYVEGDHLLGVARRGTTDEWGLPGGKVEKDEAPLDAAVREMFEETHTRPVGLRKFYRGWSLAQHKVVQVYTADELEGLPVQGDAGSVGFISWTDLLNGPFGRFHREVHRRWLNEVSTPVGEC